MITLYGKNVFRDICIGKIYYYDKNEPRVERLNADNPEKEIELYREANKKAISQLKSLYDKALEDIEKHCFENTKSAIVQSILDYAKSKYGDEPEYLWEGYDYAVLRRKDTQKWYALIMDVPQKKLKLEGDSIVDILDIRFDAEKLAEKIDGKRFFFAYHMNKKHWITILLNGSVSPEEIFGYIDDSYQMAKK